MNTIPISDLDKRAAASSSPELWADVLAISHALARLERDLARVRKDIDACPATPCGRAFARVWYRDAQRREQEIAGHRAHLDRLRRDCGAVFVDSAAAEAPARAGAWISVPGGSVRDG